MSSWRRMLTFALHKLCLEAIPEKGVSKNIAKWRNILHPLIAGRLQQVEILLDDSCCRAHILAADLLQILEPILIVAVITMSLESGWVAILHLSGAFPSSFTEINAPGLKTSR